MSELEEYQKKRQFGKTPEPEGKELEKNGKKIFVIQRHAARRLHFDFRVEYNGVLVSFAVPKGLPTKRGEKKLAIHVEDHPLEYQYFEGEIPAGNYGAGQVEIWDRGTYTSEQEISKGLEKGHLDFNLKGSKVIGTYTFVRMKRSEKEDEWLVLLKDETGSHKERILSQAKKRIVLPPYYPMLATRIEGPFDDNDWIFEIKWDGYRIIGQKSGEDKHLWSRNNNDLAGKFPIIADDFFKSKTDTVIDGEIVSLDEKGRSNFQDLQNQIHPERQYMYVFDMLFWEGYDLQDLALEDRKELLRIYLNENNFNYLRYSDEIREKGELFFDEAKKQNLEGIMAKKLGTPYVQAKRTDYWQKIKNVKTQEAIIVGYTAPGGSRIAFGSLVLAVRENNKLKYIGRVGTGFDDKTLTKLKTEFDKIKTTKKTVEERIPDEKNIIWLKPKMIAQIKYNEITNEGLIRQGAFLGLREDISPTDVHLEKVTMHKDQKKPQVTHPDKIYWPKEKITKGQMVEYYEKMGEYILPYIKDKPLSLNRFPDGINGIHFYQKNFETVSSFIKTFEIPSSDEETTNYIIGKDVNTLIYIANLGSIEINPWASAIDKLDYPDYLVIDLDPEEIEFEKVAETALMLHKLMDELEIPNYCKTSGATGIHVFVPMGGKYSYEQVRNFAQIIAHLGNDRLPEITSLARSPGKRQKRVYLDYLQNAKGQTIASAYSIRPVSGAQVSMPLEWDEVDKIKPSDFTIFNAHERLKNGDIFKPVLSGVIDIANVLKKIG